MPTISFNPKNYNVNWDGVSPAKVSFALACPSTAASYSATAYPVFTAARFILIPGGTAIVNTLYSFPRGVRLAANVNGNLSYAGDSYLTVDASTNAVTITFSSLTSTYLAHAWKLTETKSGVERVLLKGLISREIDNAYRPTFSSIPIVSGVTAAGGCQ